MFRRATRIVGAAAIPALGDSSAATANVSAQMGGPFATIHVSNCRAMINTVVVAVMLALQDNTAAMVRVLTSNLTVSIVAVVVMLVPQGRGVAVDTAQTRCQIRTTVAYVVIPWERAGSVLMAAVSPFAQVMQLNLIIVLALLAIAVMVKAAERVAVVFIHRMVIMEIA
jgi:hypothetical protein